MQFAEKMHPQKMDFRDYVEALEEERRKIQVFLKELPLSFELVTQGKQTKPKQNKKKKKLFQTPFCDMKLKSLPFASGSVVWMFSDVGFNGFFFFCVW